MMIAFFESFSCAMKEDEKRKDEGTRKGAE
jgi:hypothetical protein